MCQSHERLHGSPYHKYGQPYECPDDSTWTVCCLPKLQPSTVYLLIARDTGDSGVSAETLEAGVSAEIAKVDKFKALMEKEFPILQLFQYSVAISGACLWILSYDRDKAPFLYDSWRHSAGAIWEGTSKIATQADLKIEDFGVEPLPGPWRYAFL